MELKRCPVCSNIGRAYGKKTCGGIDCVKTWKTWPSKTKYEATLKADNNELYQLYKVQQESSLLTDDSPLSAEDQLAILNAPKEEQDFLAKILGKENK